MPSTADSLQSFRLAIIGGGIGGICTALGLLEDPHIDVQIYEAASGFGEIGAGIGVSENAQRALKLISSATRAAFDKVATTNMWPVHKKRMGAYIVGEGEDEGKTIHTLYNDTGLWTVHRARFLDELVKSVPSQRTHFNKRVEHLDDEEGSPVTIRFKDGTTAHADAVIGADGIRSFVREHLLGQEAAKPVFAGSVAYRALVPLDKAVQVLGAEIAQNAHIFCGKDKFSVSYPMDRESLFNVLILDFDQPELWEHESWILPVDPNSVRAKFSSWGAHSRGLVELFLASDTPSMWALHDHLPAPTYTKTRIALMGDAAHATTPFQGQGAAQSMEDALVLKTVLAHVSNAKMIPNAFLAYDQVRRVRTQRIVSTSREAGALYSLNGVGVGGDLEKMRELLEVRMRWVWNRDMGEQSREALQLFRESL